MLRLLLAILACCLALPASAALVDNGDGTITDTVTGLMWDKCSWGQTDITNCSGGAASILVWNAALQAATSANGSAHRGHNDWRVPNVSELESITDLTFSAPAINGTAFPNTPTAFSTYYWTSTTWPQLTSSAVMLSFYNGGIYGGDKTSASYHVRLVRGGLAFAAFDALGDTTPDAFAFTAQTGVALNAVATSNSITVAGINAPSAISITGGTYAINGGAHTAAAGTVNNGDTVVVRQTASGANSTTTTATLSIGGVTGNFAVTTVAPAVDTTPDAFAFTAQTGAALNAVAMSNSITVAGINAASAISITGGTYAINGGAFTAAAGNVNNGDTVVVRQTASATPSATTTATLSIGGVTGNFDVTTSPPVRSYSAASPGGGGIITASFVGGGASCGFATASFGAATPPNGINLPHGVFNFTTTNCGAGATLNFTVTYPAALPAGTRFYKFGPEFGGSPVAHWYLLPGAVVSGNQITFSVTDNGQGDSDPAVGFIADPGGPGALGVGGVAAIPTLSAWAMLALSLLLAGPVLVAGRRRPWP